jgi:hypothetical protein
MFIFKICLILFVRESQYLMPGMHPTEIYYNSSFTYTGSIHIIRSRNLTPTKDNGLPNSSHFL